MTVQNIVADEIIIVSRQKLLAAARTLREEHGYEAYDPSLLTLALYEWMAETTEQMVNNAVKIIAATEHGMEWARFDGWVRYLSDKKQREWAMSVKPKAERRGVEVT